MKKVNVIRMAISGKVRSEIQSILDDRDEVKRLEKMQEERKQKIQDLLAFSASDAMSPGSRRLSQRLLKIDNEEEGGKVATDELKSIKSGSSKSSGSRSSKKASRQAKLKKQRAASSAQSGGGGASVLSSSSTSRATAARRMANLGGDVASGMSHEELRQGRKLRGECEDCGQKLFQKTMFKTVPLNVPNKVEEGRCLLCAPI